MERAKPDSFDRKGRKTRRVWASISKAVPRLWRRFRD
jgi:hypothetical protein